MHAYVVKIPFSVKETNLGLSICYNTEKKLHNISASDLLFSISVNVNTIKANFAC